MLFRSRTSPAEGAERFLALKSNYPQIIWNYPEWPIGNPNHPEPWSQRLPAETDIHYLKSLLKHSDVSINMCSTMSLDFALWKKAKPEHIMRWQSPWGEGFPGWHIECSAISLRYLLGEDFLTPATKDFLIDIQGGGTDLIFPHHFMSAALAHGMTGIDFAQSYLHVGMIGLGGEKMSKSKGNLVFVSHLISEGTHPASIRLALMNHHYSEDFMWDSKHLESSNNLLSRLQSVLGSGFSIEATSYIQSMVEALASNLDTKRVLQILEDWIEGSEKAPESLSIDDTGLMARALDSLLGLSL